MLKRIVSRLKNLHMQILTIVLQLNTRNNICFKQTFALNGIYLCINFFIFFSFSATIINENKSSKEDA